MEKKRKYTMMWRNPRTGKMCYVAAEGLVLTRVEDIVKQGSAKNTRLLSYDDLKIELMEMKHSFMPLNGKEIKVNPQERVYKRK